MKKKKTLFTQHLLALVADIVCISVHGESSRVVVETCSWRRYCLALVQSLVLQPHQSLSPHVLVELLNRVEQVLDHRVIDFVLEPNNETNKQTRLSSQRRQSSHSLRGNPQNTELGPLQSEKLWQRLTLQMGHNINPNVILGPSQRFSRTRRVH